MAKKVLGGLLKTLHLEGKLPLVDPSICIHGGLGEALEMTVQRRLPGEVLLAHWDRGSQYASDHCQRLLAKHDILCSTSCHFRGELPMAL